MSRRLTWQKGKPSDSGTIYYMTARFEDKVFHLSRGTVDGKDKFVLYLGSKIVKVSDVRLEALNHAEGML